MEGGAWREKDENFKWFIECESGPTLKRFTKPKTTLKRLFQTLRKRNNSTRIWRNAKCNFGLVRSWNFKWKNRRKSPTNKTRTYLLIFNRYRWYIGKRHSWIQLLVNLGQNQNRNQQFEISTKRPARKIDEQRNQNEKSFIWGTFCQNSKWRRHLHKEKWKTVKNQIKGSE